jgi:hypothetical protein
MMIDEPDRMCSQYFDRLWWSAHWPAELDVGDFSTQLGATDTAEGAIEMPAPFTSCAK